MFKLKNEIPKDEAIERLKNEQFKRTTASFYRYVNISDPMKLRDELFTKWSTLGVLGRIYLAEEGINAQLNVPSDNFQVFVDLLNSYPEFKDVPLKIAVEDGMSFWKLSIKVKKYIVADGLPAGTYDISNVGKHLNAKEWNEAMENPETMVVDMRNHYESRIGKFKDAIAPTSDTFREELQEVKEILKDKKDKKILLYCTGGVRCEKASSFLKHQGFQDVNQLYGGIIQYANEIKKEGLPSKFVGKNYVFDARTEEAITDDVLTSCDVCGRAEDTMVNCENETCNLLFVQCKNCADALDGACSMECNRIINLPEAEQAKLRKAYGESSTSMYKSRIKPNLKSLSLLDSAKLLFRRFVKMTKSLVDEVAEDQNRAYIGKVKHFFAKAQIIEFIFEGHELKDGDELVIDGNTTKNYRFKVKDLQVDGLPANIAHSGGVVTLKVGQYIRKNDSIYKIV